MRPQNHWARVSISANPPAAWENEIRRSGYLLATPPETIAVAARAPSAPTPNVAVAGPGIRSVGAGMPCTNTAADRRCASAQKPSKRGSCSEVPLMLEAISTPARPCFATSVSSAAAMSGSCIGTVPRP